VKNRIGDRPRFFIFYHRDSEGTEEKKRLVFSCQRLAKEEKQKKRSGKGILSATETVRPGKAVVGDEGREKGKTVVCPLFPMLITFMLIM